MTDLTRRSALRLALSATALPLLAKAASAASHATTHNVTIQNMSFNPAALQINAGDTVVFTNMDNPRHSATDLGGAWDTGLLAKGQSASLTFPAAGTYNYRCTPHGNMRGSITVA